MNDPFASLKPSGQPAAPGASPAATLEVRQARLLTLALCAIYALGTLYLGIASASLLLQALSASPEPNSLRWGLAFAAAVLLLAAAAGGLWRARRWGVLLSLALLSAALGYSILGDLQYGSRTLALLKAVLIIPALLAGHRRLWKASTPPDKTRKV